MDGPEASRDTVPPRLALGPAVLEPRGSGALWWPAERLLAVADLHLGRAGRMARRGAPLLPPYETEDTLARLAAEIAALAPARVICVGDSFDDGAAAAALPDATRERIAALAAGRDWLWIAGNHDPRPTGLAGRWAAEAEIAGLHVRHQAGALPVGAVEISAHFHPKARIVLRGRAVTRRCFLEDARRLILPAFGTYAGGLDATDPAFDRLLAADARAWLTGRRVVGLPRAGLA